MAGESAVSLAVSPVRVHETNCALGCLCFSATDQIRCPWPLSTTSSVWDCLQTVALQSSLTKVIDLRVGRHWGGPVSIVLCDQGITPAKLSSVAWVRETHVPCTAASCISMQMCCIWGQVATVSLWPLPGGDALLVSLVCRSVLHHFHFKGSVHSISFSPDGR